MEPIESNPKFGVPFHLMSNCCVGQQRALLSKLDNEHAVPQQVGNSRSRELTKKVEGSWRDYLEIVENHDSVPVHYAATKAGVSERSGSRMFAVDEANVGLANTSDRDVFSALIDRCDLHEVSTGYFPKKPHHSFGAVSDIFEDRRLRSVVRLKTWPRVDRGDVIAARVSDDDLEATAEMGANLEI
jgi:hypothetical protein